VGTGNEAAAAATSENKGHAMARVFVSFLGMGGPGLPGGRSPASPGYALTTYAWQGRPCRPTHFAQAAILEALGPATFDRVAILCTKESLAAHYPLLRDELLGLGCREVALTDPVQAGLIPTDMTAERQWQWFETLLGRIDAGDRVVFDFSHGMRAVPIVFSSAIGFLGRSKGIRLDAVLYAWYDKNRPTDEPHPIIDMKEFYAINDWAESVSRLAEEADARKLAALAGEARLEGLRSLAEPELAEAFRAMTDCIRNVDVNHISTRVAEALACVERHRARAGGTARVLLDLVWEKFRGLACDYPPTGRYDAPYFQTQVAIIEVLAEHRLFMQAFTAMRECIGSIGMAGLGGRHGGAMVTTRGRKERKRFAEVFVNMIQFPERDWSFTTEPESLVARDFAALKPWYDELAARGAVASLKSIAEKKPGEMRLVDFRNGFDHAWTSTSGAPDGIDERCREYIAALRSAVQVAVQGGTWMPPEGSAEEERREVFLNLSNHAIAAWPAEQTRAAAALGLGQPVELEGGMPQVPAEADEAVVAALAEDIAVRAVHAGATGAFVAGDFTLTVALVTELRRRGIRCFAAASERAVQEEIGPGGASVRRSIFRFARWREYAPPC